MSDDSPRAPALTNPLWYLMALMIVLGGSMAGTIIGAGAWNEIRDASITPVGEPVDTTGKTLAIYADLTQEGREIACTTKPEEAGDDVEPAAAEVPAITISVNDNGVEWHLVGLVTEGGEAEVIACAPADGGTDNANYGYALVDRSGITLAERTVQLSLIAGIFLAVLVLIRRYRHKRGA